ncbi:hypothetical protein Hdeb2414_s0001g00024201 [Helianthus debilis subsp. tardiflorus]
MMVLMLVTAKSRRQQWRQGGGGGCVNRPLHHRIMFGSNPIDSVNTRVNSGQQRVNTVKPVTAVNWSAVVRVMLFQSRSMQFGSVRAFRFRVAVNTWSTPVKRQNGSKSQYKSTDGQHSQQQSTKDPVKLLA